MKKTLNKRKPAGVRTLDRVVIGIIPAQSAIRYAAHQLRVMQHRAQQGAIVLQRAGQDKAALSLELQADDMRQIAQFLEERIIPANASGEGDQT